MLFQAADMPRGLLTRR